MMGFSANMLMLHRILFSRKHKRQYQKKKKSDEKTMSYH